MTRADDKLAEDFKENAVIYDDGMIAYKSVHPFEDKALIVAALRRPPSAEVERLDPHQEFHWVWQFEDGSIDDKLHATEKYCQIAADKEMELDPSVGKITVVKAKVISAHHSLREPQSGMVDEKKALAEFTDYFVANYPGPSTIIHDPRWHAPKIFRAAQRALAAAKG